MKKIVAFLAAIFMTASMGLTACGDGGSSSNHEHSFESVQTVAATCSEQGYTLYRCSCGEENKKDYTDKTQHSYTSKKVASTCKEKGYTLHTCSACGDNYKSDKATALAEHKGNGTCSVCKADLYAIFANEIKERGVWEADNGYYRYTTSTNSGEATYKFHFLYTPDEESITLFVFVGSNSFGIMIPKVNTGKYVWRLDYFGYEMNGIVTASTWTEYSKLSYASSTFPSSMTTSSVNLATSFLNLTLSATNLFLFGAQIDVSNFGFILY